MDGDPETGERWACAVPWALAKEVLYSRLRPRTDNVLKRTILPSPVRFFGAPSKVASLVKHQNLDPNHIMKISKSINNKQGT